MTQSDETTIPIENFLQLHGQYCNWGLTLKAVDLPSELGMKLKYILESDSSERLIRRRLRFIESEHDILHRASIVHLKARAMFLLPATRGLEESIDEDIRMQCMVHYGNKPCFVDPDLNAHL